MMKELFKDMNYVYRLVFSYVGDPKKIALPFVSYRPNQALFHFEKIISKDQVGRVQVIAETLNQAIGYRMKMQEQFLVGGKWTNQNPNATIEKPSTI